MKIQRRELLGLLALGVAATVTGCSSTPPAPVVYTAPPEPRPYTKGAPDKFALTVDDGLSTEALAAYVKLAEDADL